VGSVSYALRGAVFRVSKPIGSRAKRIDRPGRKARHPTAIGAHRAPISEGVQSARVAANKASRPTAEAKTKTKATNEASSTAAQARRNWSLPMPCPSASGRRPEPPTPTLGRAPSPRAMAEARSS